MSAHIEWFAAQNIDIDGSARPGSYLGNDGSENSVAAVRIADQFTGDCVIIEGRPERLVELARDLLKAAEAVEMQTIIDPSLRRMYGLASLESEGTL